MLTSPLASELRPETWSDILGQDHLVGQGGALRSLIDDAKVPVQSIILHGPPGTGKTTIARLFAGKGFFVELSAISSGVANVRDEILQAEKRRLTFDLRTVLFVDEIHRFAKNQQEALLAAVESGLVTLVGATTENPGTSIVRALLSRCLVFELEPLSGAAIAEICQRALSGDFLGKGVSLSEDALAAITRHASGDARKALNLLQAAAGKLTDGAKVIGSAEIAATGVEQVMDFDLDGDFHYDTISAFIKSIRGSDVDASLEYLALMIVGGERPEFIGRRLMILAAEDVGLADPNAMQVAVAAHSIASQVGMPAARIPLAEATIYLALAPKSNATYLAIDSAIETVQRQRPRIPKQLTRSGADSYQYPHDFELPVVAQQYRFGTSEHYQPGQQGLEKELQKRLGALRSILRRTNN